ncbi:MAG: molybdate ABC transporter permease subunit [Planctomycetota bacterium]|jgi:molybdate transport system permease protein|nr:molybdate ABC transporter permease subunit [Planctomycetota bacterium]
MLSPAEWSALSLSVGVGLWSTALVAPPGIALGWLLARKQFPGKILLEALIYLPLVLTPVVVGYCLLMVFGRNGPLGGLGLAFTYSGAVLAAAVVALPLVVRSVRTAIELVDPGLEHAAAVLGAGPCRRLVTITLPLAMPGIVAGLVLGFARSLGEFGATITFAGNISGQTTTLPIAIYTATQVPGGDGLAGRLTLLSILLSFAALAGSEWFLRRLRRRAEGLTP